MHPHLIQTSLVQSQPHTQTSKSSHPSCEPSKNKPTPLRSSLPVNSHPHQCRRGKDRSATPDCQFRSTRLRRRIFCLKTKRQWARGKTAVDAGNDVGYEKRKGARWLVSGVLNASKSVDRAIVTCRKGQCGCCGYGNLYPGTPSLGLAKPPAYLY